MNQKTHIKRCDKLLCRRTHYDIKDVHIWQIGKYYEVVVEPIVLWKRPVYKLSSEQTTNISVTEREIDTFFLVNEKKVRKFKLLKIKNSGK